MSAEIVLLLRLILALALYFFLAVAFRMIWQELRAANRHAVDGKAQAIRLKLLAPRRAPVVRTFAGTDVVLGRDSATDFPIPDLSVSSRHALVSFHDGKWWLHDLGSTSGTQLNQARLALPTVLASGDEIGFGQARVVVSLRHVRTRANAERGRSHHG